MAKDPKTGKFVKKFMDVKRAVKTFKKKVDAKKKNTAAYKTGKRDSDSESDFSYRSTYSAGGTRKVRRRKKNEDGTYDDSESYHSSQDEEGAERRQKRRQERDSTVDSTNDMDTTRDSEEDSDCSYRSEVSEGGTRTVVKQQRLRDEDGNIIGYGEPETVEPDLFRTGSISPRQGSISDGSEGAYGKYMAEKLGELDNIADTMDLDAEQETEEEKRKNERLLELNRLQERVFDPSWPGTNPSDKPNIQLPNFDNDYKRLGGPLNPNGSSKIKGGSRQSVDFGNMTEEEKQKFLEEQERKKQEKEKKEREKREKRDRQNLRRELTSENIEKEREKERMAEELKDRRQSVMSQRLAAMTPNGKHQSMVTYEKGSTRDINTPLQKTDNRQSGLAHSDWKRKPKEIKNNNVKKRDSNAFDYTPNAKLNSLNRKFGQEKGTDENTEKTLKRDKNQLQENVQNGKKDITGNNASQNELQKLVFDENGNVSLKSGEKLNLKNLTKEDLKKLGIDPNLSKAEQLKILREKFGNDAVEDDDDDYEFVREGNESDEDTLSCIMSKERSLAKAKDITGVRRVNLLLRAGGTELQLHLQNVLDASNLTDFAADLDERDSSIDFMCHYRLVDQGKLDSYAKAFVVEDCNLDTVITFQEIKTALDGVPTVQHVTNKQKDYVLKVLHINDATLVTFRMFAVVTALCERITAMDSLSKHLMEICNLADIERKLGLYQAMFYQNIPSDRNTNFITSESLKIELIAGGLNWKQQKFIMDKMSPNDWGEISFLDYMCYIPLFMSMHDNIVDNPLDMSDKKYQIPPRKRPPSVQRDMNPLGQPLSQKSTFLLKKQARDLEEGRVSKECLTAEKVELLEKYAKLPDIPVSRGSKKKLEEEEDEKMDLIY